MTGLFQIFDRYRALTRSKSVPKKVTAGSHGQALPGGERDPSCINFAYHMFQDESAQRRATLACPERIPQVEATREPRRSSIDNSEVMVAKAPEAPKDIQPTVEARSQPPRTSLDSRPKPRLSFYFKEDAPVDDTSPSSATEVPTSVSTEPPGNPVNGSVQRRTSDPTVVATILSVDGKPSGTEDKEKKSRDFKGMIKGPFKRRRHRGGSQESTGSSGSSFDMKETEQLKKVSELQSERKEGSNNLFLPAQDGLAEDDEYKEFSVFTGSPNGWLESREGSTPRLTVELKSGPQLTRRDDQRVLIDERSRLAGLEDSGEHMPQNGHALVPFGFKGSPNAIDYEGLRSMQRDRARKSVEGRESPGRLYGGKAAASRFSLDGTSAPRQSSGTPRRSIDGHHQGPGQNRFAQYVQRSLEASSPFSLRRDNSWANSPGRAVDGAWDNDMEDSRWKASSVVAKLMGLEELPNFDLVMASNSSSPMRTYPSLQRTAYYLQSDESPSRDDDDSYQVFGTDEVVTPLRKDTKFMSGVPLTLAGRQQATPVSTSPRLQLGYPISPENKGNLTPASPKHLSVSPKHHMIESMPQVFKHQVEQKSSSEGLLYSDMDHRLRQLGLKNSIQERKTLKQILEAMHLKGLLQPPRHMDPDWKRNPPRQGSNGAVAKSLFDNKKESSSSFVGDSFKEDIFGLDYKDIPMYISAQKAKSSAGGHIPDGSRSPSRRTGEASIVVMKPLNTKSASKLALANTSLDLSVGKGHETARETSASRSLLTSATSAATLEKDSSVSTNTRTSSRSEASTVSNKLRPRSRSVDSRGQDNVEELPLSVRQRRERIAARTARAKSEGGDILLRDSPKSARSASPVVKSSAKPSSPARSAFGSSVSQTGDAKSRVKTSIEKKHIKSTTSVTKKAKSGSETMKERTASEQEVTEILNRNQLDSKLVAGDADKIAASVPRGTAIDAAEVAVLRSKSSVKGGSYDLANSVLSVDEKNHLEERCRDFLDSAADSCSESLDITLERSRNGSPINVMSPTFTSFESRSSRHSRHSSERSLDGFYDTQERYESKLEDSELQTDSDAALYTDQGSSDVSMTRESQVEELGLNAFAASEASPRGFSVRRKGHEGRDEHLTEGADQPSPISVLNNINFHEGDSTPSPTSEKAGLVSPQDCSVSESGEDQEEVKTPVWQLTDPSTPTQLLPAPTGDPLKDLIYKVARSLNLDDQNSFLNKPTLEIQVPYVPDLFSPTSVNSIPSSFASKDDEKTYVRYIMMASGVTEEATALKEWPQSGQLMTPEFFDQLEERLELRESARKQNAYLSGEERTEYLKQALDRRVLFDCVNSILEKKLYPYYNPQPWGSRTFLRKPTGAKLVEEIWDELQAIHTCAMDDDILYTILQKDFTQPSEKWVDFSVEIGEIGMEIEEMILDELMEATVQEWS